MLYYPRRAVMVDIETYATKPNATILSIGALLFDSLGQKTDIAKGDMVVAPHFNIVLETDQGRFTDPGTVKWWEEQSEAARRPIFGEGIQRVSLVEGLGLFQDWLKRQQADALFACSPSFDCIILEDAVEAEFGERLAVPFWHWQDVRSLRSFVLGSGKHPEFDWGTTHDALSDCVSQAFAMQACFHWRKRMESK